MESGGPDNITVYNMITRPAPVLGTMSDNVFNIRLNKYLRNQTYYHTHPHKKGPVMENYTRHLTSFSMVIYQAEHDLWCPINVGWENFAQLQIFQVK